LTSAALVALLGFSGQALALALGAATVKSYLGEPLRAEIEVPDITSQEASTFHVSMASPKAFQAAGVTYSSDLAGTQISLRRRANGQAYLRVEGVRPINEPFLGIVIQADWGAGQVVRDYTMLIDPPNHGPTNVVATSPQVPQAKQPTVATQVKPKTPQEEQGATPQRGRTPPAAAPAAAPASAPSAGEQITVKRGDTASGIVRDRLPEGVSLDQMLIALQRGNPNAFIRGNVNLIKAGAVLNLPTAEQASTVTEKQARQAVRLQTSDFLAYRRGVAAHATQTAAAPSPGRTSAGSVQPQVQNAAQPKSPDRLHVGGGSAASSTETRLAQGRRADEQKRDAGERAQNIDDLNKILQGASSPAPAKQPPAAKQPGGVNVPIGAPPVQTTPAPAAPAPTPPAQAKPAQTTPAPTTTTAQATPAQVTPPPTASQPPSAAAPAQPPAPQASDAASAASQAQAAPAQPPKAPAKPPVKAPPPPPEPSIVDTLSDNWMPLLGGAAVLLLGGGYLFYRSRKNKAAPADESLFTESQAQPDSFFSVSGGQQVDTSSSHTSAAASRAGASSMVYSPSQLDAAGDVDPVAEADVYLAYGRDMQAEEILKEALRTHPGRAAVYRKLAEIYNKRRDIKALETLATEARNVTGGTGADWEFIAKLGHGLDPDNALYSASSKPQAQQAAVPVPTLRHAFGADTQPYSELPAPPPPPSVGSDSAMDLDLDLDADSASVPLAPASVQPPPATAPAPMPTAPAPIKPPTAPAPLDFDLSAPSLATPQPPAAPARAEAPKDSGHGNSMIDFDMSALSVNPDSRSGGNTRHPGAGDDPMGTKLALAQEFQAIGDTEGARTLLKEVIAQATGTVKAQAERFLSELD